MNDTTYTFVETVRDRKSVASSARRKVNGSKSKKCTLPSDNLTAAQKKKLNGAVKNYCVNHPMSWSEFKSMPLDLQQEHLDYIQSRFEVGVNTISRAVFGMGDGTLAAHARRFGLKTEPRKGLAPPKAEEALSMWANGEDDRWPEVEDALCTTEGDPEPTPEGDPEPTPDSDKTNESTPPTFALNVLRELSMILDGSAEQISETLFAYLAGRNATVEVTIKFHN